MELATEPRRALANDLHLKRILVPVDFSPLSKKALQYAQRLAQEFNAELTLFHALEPEMPPTFDGMTMTQGFPEDDAPSRQKEFKALVSSVRSTAGVKVSSAFRRGLAAFEIIDAAKELDADLIVIATHGYTGWKHFCIGSTAERVVRAAPCPVMVVREKEREFI